MLTRERIVNILVLNTGSSTLKFRLYRMNGVRPPTESEEILAGGQVERIGKPDARLAIAAGAQAMEAPTAVGALTAGDAAREVVRRLTTAPSDGRQRLGIDAVGHRVVHGGSRFYRTTLVTPEVLGEIRSLNEIAPLHNPSGVAGIETCMEALPTAQNVAVFDTAFHHSLPEIAARYALPTELADRFHIRRYGFHGISYRYVVERVLQCLGRPALGTRLIVCHLGNGASVCAVQDGASIDTSMGFTPLEGLVMGTRCGDIDPGILIHLLRHDQMTVDQLDELLNRKSGMLGLSGLSGDVRDLENAASSGDAAAELALEAFAYRVTKYIGAYAAALGGVDALVFTAGIGEHSASMRARICEHLGFLGLSLDDTRNPAATGHEPAAIGSPASERVWVVSTDEERQIARETYTLLS